MNNILESSSKMLRLLTVSIETSASQNTSEYSLPENDPATPDGPVVQHGLENSRYRFRRVASKTVLAFHSQDPENPPNWSKWKKRFVLTTGVMSVSNSTLAASLPSGAVPYIAKDFNITNQQQLVLPISIFLIGYVFGPIICGSLSESFGRKIVTLIPFLIFMCFTLGCALCQNWESLLVFRLFIGIMGSAPISIVGGVFADIFDNPRERGVVMSYFMAATTVGPLVGPFLSGFISTVHWRWTFWTGLMISGVTLPFMALVPETYAPILLQQRARTLRKETGNNNIVAPIELGKRDLKQVLTVTLTRPVRMFFGESIVLFSCLYLSIVYSIFFMYFQAYPIIFRGIYNMNTGVSGLMYLPIMLGAGLACFVFNAWDNYLYKAKDRGAEWSSIEEYRRLPLACIGGPLYVISLFWLGWTASPSIHWAVPMLSGIPFGMGFMLIFIAMLNYLSDAYETFAASAQSAANSCRAIFAVVLPLATTPMFDKLGVNWSCSLLAFISMAMTAIPFAFIHYGHHIRANSKFCQYLRETKEAEKRAEEEDDARQNGRDVSDGNHHESEKAEADTHTTPLDQQTKSQ
ncbi:hypothetical protein AJ80_00131 [Polytolypa hystricis UAMH7299]|uniref:Major facilitator superfamily (MFS) profile domain-containing protein n=1 Tax=Polytolypa hystricis (strain UAMH7299) TaxID=1447883 RepID=A0A2B7Z4A8_POLH7|nr:hypothetical protein AJ80_00131 [Polytolypa hystricis UAMH7299]